MTSADDGHRATLRRLALIESDRRAERRRQTHHDRVVHLRHRWKAIRGRGAPGTPTATPVAGACGDLADCS